MTEYEYYCEGWLGQDSCDGRLLLNVDDLQRQLVVEADQLVSLNGCLSNYERGVIRILVYYLFNIELNLFYENSELIF